VADLMLLLVLVVAVHFGRRGGQIAAVGASVAYVLMTAPQVADSSGLTSQILLLIVLRVGTYGFIGILGGDACGRLRYVLARMEHSATYDQWSQVFSQSYVHASLRRSQAALERYGENYSIVTLALAPAITAEMSPSRTRTVIRGVAKNLRGDLRMVDEVGRLEDGQFVIMLANTPRTGADIVAQRVAKNIRQLLGARDESVTAQALGGAEDAAALAAFVASIEPAPEIAQEGSGAYSSAGESERNPAAASTSSAPGASTLNMSTAAAPEGSTKQ
jgi:GGDEF domain-containing protein